MTWQPGANCAFRLDLVEDERTLGMVWRIKRGEYHAWTLRPIRRLPNERTVTAAKRAVEMAILARKKAA